MSSHHRHLPFCALTYTRLVTSFSCILLDRNVHAGSSPAGNGRCVGLFLDILDMSRCGLKASAANSMMLLCEDPHVQVFALYLLRYSSTYGTCAQNGKKYFIILVFATDVHV